MWWIFSLMEVEMIQTQQRWKQIRWNYTFNIFIVIILRNLSKILLAEKTKTQML